ncbi:hypothetical protein IX332_000693 [Porphyromonas levii]|uniref:Secreted protein n=1 Tax=Porphyromonas levii TaxID=28114 RepID=A0A4Y8WRC3_9PORP|nr:hypothetical protein [Porphyromonas levii]MBR8729373.1 hypothetical protein [Porphyromonas levii]MBR8760302.1 hypothetical protein [Porphyromonas levii]MBR8769757.1 hypothetical protein [Porphyromonas levii]TFH95436.1 hypothetical protein E4P48_07960 [Porphyromonas levii]TFH96978.1 hypothetical protein E4P47_01290 [Porphyromonas levii]
MKKLILGTCAVLFSSVAFASDTPHYIITDCGTIHQIPDDATLEDACEIIDRMSAHDCRGTEIKSKDESSD